MGSRRRSAFNASRVRVSSFSLVSNSLRAANHSSLDTTWGRLTSVSSALGYLSVATTRPNRTSHRSEPESHSIGGPSSRPHAAPTSAAAPLVVANWHDKTHLSWLIGTTSGTGRATGLVVGRTVLRPAPRRG